MINLKDYNTFGVEALAEKVLIMNKQEDIFQFVEKHNGNKEFFLIVGGGSNILFTSNVRGTVLLNRLMGIEIIESDAQWVTVKYESGVLWDDLVLFAVQNGFWGIENLSIIPGTCGAAPVQNIGAYGQEIKDVITGVEYIDMQEGNSRYLNNLECSFGYRDSIFKRALFNRAFITSITLRLAKQAEPCLKYPSLREITVPGKTYSVSDIRNFVIQIRESKLPDFKKLGNAGSFFKNPELQEAHFYELKQHNEKIPGYKLEDGLIRVPAAWFIEESGFKNTIFGNVGTYKKHPLIIVNRGGASGLEILEFSQKIQKAVFEAFGIILSPEVNII
ncbi:MAG: UDP-N-acetylmuramate dehydrogenase [Ignavibacteriales bacterium]|nr:UDP-N-acetylmuramate dehydrogenase [Ignavibacteriales bacterium]